MAPRWNKRRSPRNNSGVYGINGDPRFATNASRGIHFGKDSNLEGTTCNSFLTSRQNPGPAPSDFDISLKQVDNRYVT